MCSPENIANAPHAPNLDVAAKLGQLFAEPRHLRLKRIGLDLVIEAVDRLDQDFARDDAVASHQKSFEDQGFAAAKEGLVVGHSDLVGADAKFDVPERQDRRYEQSRPPQEGPYPRDELLRLEGFAKIIVRPAVQPIDHVFLGVLGGQHDDSWPFRQLAQRHDDIESVAVGQHPVDDGQIVLEIAKRLPGIRKGSDDVDNPAQLPKQTAEIGANLRLIFDHKGAHRSSLERGVDGSSKIACFPLAALDAPASPSVSRYGNQGKLQRTGHPQAHVMVKGCLARAILGQCWWVTQSLETTKVVSTF